MTFKINMATLPFMFVCLCCSLFVNSEVQPENASNSFQTYSSEISTVLKHLNSESFKVYLYKEATLLHAHVKADITELSLEVNVECIHKYPEVPCSETVLTCHAFVRNEQVLNDVTCKAKPEIIVDEVPTNPSDVEVNETESIALSNEAVSSEVNEPFMAVRKDSVPCLGCPFDLNPNAEGVEELIDLALDHVGSERPNKQALVKVLKLQQQVVAGVKYILIVELGPTVCAKEANLESCPLDSNSESSVCMISFLQKPWISKEKHIIGNNCTVSQEYVKSDGKTDELSNEIDINDQNKRTENVNTPNFDHIAETGTLEEMSPSRLVDLESQIVADFEIPTHMRPKSEPVLPSTVESQVQIQEQPGFEEVPQTESVLREIEPTPEQMAVNDDFKPYEEVSEGLTPQVEVITTQVGNIEGESTIHEIEETKPKEQEKSTTEQHEIKPKPEQIEEIKPKSEEATQPPQKSKDDSSEESKNSSEENRTKRSDESSESDEETVAEVKEINKTEEVSSEEASHEQKTRSKRAIPQLEKISPEEKPLVKNLADFAAAALDDIDDDNHKRIILQILGAKKMVGDDGVYYHLIMRMGISRCLEDKPPNPYENCREKLFENYTKICKVQVYVNDDFASPKIVKSQCQNIKKDKNDSNRTNYSRFKRQLVGGQTEIDKNSEKITNLVTLGLAQLNGQTSKSKKDKPVEVLSATSQVVAGSLYRIKVKVAESECEKTDEKDLKDCKVLEGAAPKECTIKVWEKSWQNFRQFTIKCEGDDKEYKTETTMNRKRREIRKKRQVPGGEFQIEKDNEYVVKYLDEGLTRLDGESGEDNKLKIHEIVSATEQVVAGSIYRVKAKIVLSDCKKTDSTHRTKCGTLQNAKPKECDFHIFEAVWIPNSRVINVTCGSDQYSFAAQRSKRSTGFVGNDNLSEHLALFNAFLEQHKKKYSKKEYKYRFKVFRDNLYRMRMLNTYEQGTATYGVTKFADLTQSEFSKSLGLRTDLRAENEPPFAHAQIPDIDIPVEFDWRKKGAVTEVKNQEQCGSCWAFSVTGNVEGQYALKHGKLLEFSEQELVDCDTEDQGCNGGLMDTAYRQIEKLGGLETEQDYPYDAEDETCHFNRSLARVQLSGAVNISQNEDDMAKWLVANGPISIAINANAMQFYMGGVSHPFKFLCNPKNLDHGVLIVGYGIHKYPLFNKTMPYWIVKNSWGTSWGEQGYYRVYRGDGTCGLNQTPSSAIVV